MRLGAVPFRLAGLISAAALFAALGTGASARSVPQETGAISGVVTDTVTGRPLAGAVVELTIVVDGGAASGLRAFGRLVTDPRGRFVFTRLPAMQGYRVRVTRRGYDNARYPGNIALENGQWFREANVGLVPFGSVAGRVLDERGEPVVGVVVRAFTVGPLGGREQPIAGLFASTDDRGAYRIANLLSGRYFISVLSVQATMPVTAPDAPQQLAVGRLVDPFNPPRATGEPSLRSPGIDVDGRHRLVVSSFATPPPPDAGRPRAYPQSFYPGVPSLADATPIAVAPGIERAGVDLRLVPESAVRVSGRVTGAADGVAGLLLRMMPAGSENLGYGSEAATTVVEADETFTFLNVPAGSYTIVARAANTRFARSGSTPFRLPEPAGYVRGLGDHVWGDVPLTVADTDVADVLLELHPAALIAGRLVFDAASGPPADRDTVHIRAEPIGGDPALEAQTAIVQGRNADFSFVIDDLLPGRYRLRARGSNGNGWNQIGLAAAGRDLSRTPLSLSAGDNFADLVITMAKVTNVVAGTVTDPAGDRRPLSVLIFPADPVLRVSPPAESSDSYLFRTHTVDSNGRYDANNLDEGDYLVVAVPQVEPDAWRTPAFVEAAAAVAERVTVAWGRDITLNLQVRELVVR